MRCRVTLGGRALSISLGRHEQVLRILLRVCHASPFLGHLSRARLCAQLLSCQSFRFCPVQWVCRPPSSGCESPLKNIPWLEWRGVNRALCLKPFEKNGKDFNMKSPLSGHFCLESRSGSLSTGVFASFGPDRFVNGRGTSREHVQLWGLARWVHDRLPLWSSRETRWSP